MIKNNITVLTFLGNGYTEFHEITVRIFFGKKVKIF